MLDTTVNCGYDAKPPNLKPRKASNPTEFRGLVCGFMFNMEIKL